jgi:thiol-disulfide isomerase/thioredoxin
MKKFCVIFALAGLLFTSCKRSQPEPAPLATIKPAPTWKLQTIDGRAVGSAELSGKVQMINFWATWCPPCAAEIPGLIQLQSKFEKDGLVIVGVSVDEGGVDLVKQFVADKKINYPVALVQPGLAEGFGNFEGIPTTFVVDRKGMIRLMHQGYVDPEEFEKLLKPLLDAR